MKISYQTELNQICDWIRLANMSLMAGNTPAYTSPQAEQINSDLRSIANGIADEYSFYSKLLNQISSNIFIWQGQSGLLGINSIAFGQLYVIISHISEAPINEQIWQDIHPDITRVAKNQFCDGYYANAKENAYKEVESAMRQLFKMLKPTSSVPKDATSLINALLSENGIYEYCDTSDVSGKNYRAGIHRLFEGAFSAYRNPSAHANLSCTRREAVEQIILASQMMYVLDGKTEGNL